MTRFVIKLKRLKNSRFPFLYKQNALDVVARIQGVHL